MRHNSSDDEEMKEVEDYSNNRYENFVWNQFNDNERSRIAQK